MVTLTEWNNANDYTVFENKDNNRKIIKVLLRDNLRKIEQYMMQQYAMKGELPTVENVTRIRDVIASTLENFEIVDTTIKKEKEIDQGIEMPITEAKHKKAKDGLGEFCYKCGLQKQDTQVVEKQGEFIRVCKECLVI